MSAARSRLNPAGTLRDRLQTRRAVRRARERGAADAAAPPAHDAPLDPWARDLARELASKQASRPSLDLDNAASAPQYSPQRMGSADDNGDGWNRTASPHAPDTPARSSAANLGARILAMLAVPGRATIDSVEVASELHVPRAEAAITLTTLVREGLLRTDGQQAMPRYAATPALQRRLQHMFAESAVALNVGELARIEEPELAFDVSPDEPQLPITAGMLSVFLPGAGQLLNGDVGRAALVFMVWSLAWLSALTPVLTFVILYAGAEAYFSAKIRAVERSIAREELGQLEHAARGAVSAAPHHGAPGEHDPHV